MVDSKIPIVVSPYVPKAPCYEVDYSRPLALRLFHGRTTDLREWEEDQIFLIGGDAVMRPETCGVIRLRAQADSDSKETK